MYYVLLLKHILIKNTADNITLEPDALIRTLGAHPFALNSTNNNFMGGSHGGYGSRGIRNPSKDINSSVVFDSLVEPSKMGNPGITEIYPLPELVLLIYPN